MTLHSMSSACQILYPFSTDTIAKQKFRVGSKIYIMSMSFLIWHRFQDLGHKVTNTDMYIWRVASLIQTFIVSSISLLIVHLSH